MKQTVIILSTLTFSSHALKLESMGFFDSVKKATASVVPAEALAAVESAASGDVQGAIGSSAALTAD